MGAVSDLLAMAHPHTKPREDDERLGTDRLGDRHRS
jgi:hypothetical protein